MLALALGSQFSVTECPVLLTPVPATVIVLGELPALLAIVILPLALPAAFGEKTTFKFAVWPAANVAPEVPLLNPNPVPVIVIAETVKLKFPVFFTATASVLVPPTTSFPKFRLVVDSEIARVELTPVPFSGIARLESAAVLFNVKLPVALPLVVGANAIVKLVVCPACNVSDNGLASPFTVYPVPSRESLDIVSATTPVFFSCTVCVFLLPIGTDPKLTLLGVATSSPARTPVPFTEYCT